jgi:hypothetical protein
MKHITLHDVVGLTKSVEDLKRRKTDLIEEEEFCSGLPYHSSCKITPGS